MIGLSQRVKQLRPSSTLAVTARALELRRQGVDVLAMSAGEPDFDTPDHIKEAAKRALDEGKTKYTPAAGIPELREALVQKFARENSLSLTPNQTIVTVGGKQALFNLFQAVLDPGDEVIVLAPYWVSYPEQVRFAGGVAVVVTTRPEDGFVPDPAQVAQAVSRKTKALVVNSPNNPTGAVYPREVLTALAALAEEHDFYLITDEIYEHLVYEGQHFSPGSLVPQRSITVNGAAKSYAMTGWRIGYAAGPAEVIKAMTAVQGQSTSNATSIAQWATLEALTNPASERFVAGARKAFQSRRDLITTGLADLGLSAPIPHGAFYVLADVSGIDPDEVRAAERILTEARVAVVPGTDFAAPHQVRISYATSEANIQEALGRIGSLL